MADKHDDVDPTTSADGATSQGNDKKMTETIRGKVTETRERLTARKNDIVDRGKRIKTELDRKRDVTVGKLRDGSLDRIYGVGESALRKVASVVETAGRISHIDALGKPAEKLRTRAEHIEGARGGLQRPDIADYDELNVKRVNAALAELTPYQLEKVRAYEAANKNRVTVLREVNRLLGDDESAEA